MSENPSICRHEISPKKGKLVAEVLFFLKNKKIRKGSGSGSLVPFLSPFPVPTSPISGARKIVPGRL
jgi:hypothetical protein